MIKPDYIPPSLLVEGLFCGRRLWLKAHHVEIFEETQQLQKAPNLKTHMQGLELDDTGWIYEARLPSGSRLDAWLPEEKLGIEFKSGEPHPTHLYQVWALRQELQRQNVSDAELQLWYRRSMQQEASRLAEAYGLDHDAIDEGIYAICCDHDDPDFELQLERGAALLLAELEREVPGAPKDPASAICRQCAFSDFCHI